jgi:FKBP-type peptidyl-prolyl cis-trans isomerase
MFQLLSINVKRGYSFKMKNILLIIFTVFTAAVFVGCKGSSGSFQDKVNFDKDSSYALGLNIGAGLRDGLIADNVSPDFNEFMKGMKDGMLGKDPRFSIDDAREKIETAFNTLTQEKNSDALQKEIDFLAENAKKSGIIITQSGMQYEILVEGKGVKPTADSIVKVHYEGRLIDGTLFDNSYERQEPVIFPLNQVIPGWSEGLQLMNVGSKYKLYIPSEIGYGSFGYGPIPAYATLIFTVELIEIVSNEEYLSQFNDDYDGYY